MEAPRNCHVLLHVRAYGDCSVFLAMTHMRWSHSPSGRESTDHTLCVVHCVGGLRACPTDKCSVLGTVFGLGNVVLVSIAVCVRVPFLSSYPLLVLDSSWIITRCGFRSVLYLRCLHSADTFGTLTNRWTTQSRSRRGWLLQRAEAERPVWQELQEAWRALAWVLTLLMSEMLGPEPRQRSRSLPRRLRKRYGASHDLRARPAESQAIDSDMTARNKFS